MLRKIIIFGCSLLALTARVAAHDGPHHDIERLTKLLAGQPERTDWLMERAQAFRLDGQFAQALCDLDRAAAFNADASLVAFERGLALAAANRDLPAELEFTKHLAGTRPKAVAYAERAAIRERNGRATDAIGDYSAAIQMVPKVEWYCSRARLQKQLGRLDEAAEGYRDGLAKCSGAVSIRLALLELEKARGRFDSAIELIDEVLPQAVLKADWYLQRAAVHHAAGNSDAAATDRARALTEAESAIARRPTGLRHLTRAKVFIALQQNDRAAEDLRETLRRAPSLEEAALLLKQLEPASSADRPAPVTAKP